MAGAKPIARGAIAGVLAFALVVESAGVAFAHHVHQYTDPSLDAALVEDAASGKVIFARNDKAERHPASLTKMMTLYLLFYALRAGKLTMASEIPVSANAAATTGSSSGAQGGREDPG